MSKKSQALMLLGAVFAVSFWSLKPVFVSIVDGRLGSIEMYVTAACFASVLSVVGFLLDKKIRQELRQKTIYKAIGWTALSGLCLAVWYFCFYQALYTGAKSEATIIAFTWPIIALIAVPLLSKAKLSLSKIQWGFVILAFIGTVLVSLSSEVSNSREAIIWAVVAAIGSGFYLPFAIRANSHISEALSPIRKTFISISFANGFSLLFVLILSAVIRHQFDYSQGKPVDIAVCALIGLGTYLIAEIAWTWVIQGDSGDWLGALPYMSPAVSVVLLALIFNEPTTWKIWIGLFIIVGSNIGVYVAGLMKDKKNRLAPHSGTGEIEIVSEYHS